MKQRKQYTTDLKDQEWDILEAYLERLLPTNRRGRPLAFDLRLLIDGIRYVLRNGCTWRDLPSDFPKWQTVYYHFAKWRKLGIWTKLNKYLRRQLRKELDRNEEPSAGCADSQSVKAGSLYGNGYDGGKKVNGSKRHILVDTLGLLLIILVTRANVPERKGLSRLMGNIRHLLPRLHHIWVDQGYRGLDFGKRMLLCFGVVLEVVSPPAGSKGFVLQHRRWVVERTFAWLGNYRRLSKDYEHLTSSSEAFIYMASCDIMLKQLANTNTPTWRSI
jgi:putative transposase